MAYILLPRPYRTRPDRKAVTAMDPEFDRSVRVQQTWDRRLPATSPMPVKRIPNGWLSASSDAAPRIQLWEILPAGRLLCREYSRSVPSDGVRRDKQKCRDWRCRVSFTNGVRSRFECAFEAGLKPAFSAPMLKNQRGIPTLDSRWRVVVQSCRIPKAASRGPPVMQRWHPHRPPPDTAKPASANGSSHIRIAQPSAAVSTPLTP